MSPRALLVEDDQDICELVKIILRTESFDVDIEYDGDSGSRSALNNEYDIIILDIMLPGLDGWEICKKLRDNPSTKSTPIIMLTAKSEESDRVTGLEIGADDYITKPFSPRELLARIKALLRRSANFNQGKKELHFGKLKIDPEAYQVTAENKLIPLTRKEFELLHILAHHGGSLFSREQLLEQVWGFNYFGDARTVDEHIKRVRQKIASQDPKNTYIQTVWGVGYKFEVKASDD